MVLSDAYGPSYLVGTLSVWAPAHPSDARSP